MLRAINSFYARTGVEPKFDQGDVITNGDKTIVIGNVSSMSGAGPIYTIQGGQISYTETNKEYRLVKKADAKFQYFLSNDGNAQPDLLKIALGEKEYPEWFEEEYKKL